MSAGKLQYITSFTGKSRQWRHLHYHWPPSAGEHLRSDCGIGTDIYQRNKSTESKHNYSEEQLHLHAWHSFSRRGHGAHAFGFTYVTRSKQVHDSDLVWNSQHTDRLISSICFSPLFSSVAAASTEDSTWCWLSWYWIIVTSPPSDNNTIIGVGQMWGIWRIITSDTGNDILDVQVARIVVVSCQKTDIFNSFVKRGRYVNTTQPWIHHTMKEWSTLQINIFPTRSQSTVSSTPSPSMSAASTCCAQCGHTSLWIGSTQCWLKLTSRIIFVNRKSSEVMYNEKTTRRRQF